VGRWFCRGWAIVSGGGGGTGEGDREDFQHSVVSGRVTALTGPILLALQIANASAFLLVGLLAFGDWWHGRERRRGYLAIALGCFGLVALGLEVESQAGPNPWVTGALIVLVVVSAAGLVLYRDSLLTLPLWGRALSGCVLTAAAAFAFAAGLPGATPQAGVTEPQAVALNILLAAWCVTVAEPAYRLARLSAGLPPVQRARMRSLAAGYSGLVVVAALIIVGVAIRGGWLAITLRAVALISIPPLYLGLAPPRWLHRIWRRTEELRLRRAIHELLLFSPDRSTLARRGLDWAIRLVGAEAGLIAGPDGDTLAVQALAEPEVRLPVRRSSAGSRARLVKVAVGPTMRQAIVQPLPLQSGSGQVVVVSGALSPTFGDDEVEWIGAYAASLAIALDRAEVAELATRREAELERARDLAERASRAKTEFLSRMSHELRTPLTAVIGFSELLLLEELGERREHHVSTILKAGEHLLDLINDILDIARIEEGRLPVVTEAVDVATVVAQVLDLARPMSVEREVAVDVSGIPDGLRVVADVHRVKQVLLNLVSNAVKYNHRGGWVEISALHRDGWARIAVQDTGPGLRADEVERLFSPFERLSAAASGVQGIGLGLAVSKSLTEAMGGRIGVDTSPGAGSAFWVELRATEPGPSELVPTARGDGGKLGTVRAPSLVLYVEDNPTNVGLVEGIVEAHGGLSLISVREGKHALQLAREHRPDVILLDAHLPDMDGVDVLRDLGTDAVTAKIPVVVLSADATRHQVARLLRAGAREYLTKPVRVSELVQALERHLRLGPRRVDPGLPKTEQPAPSDPALVRSDA
jgi:signal transduction histidine kinase/ActR/RegA family two-component response regulator